MLIHFLLGMLKAMNAKIQFSIVEAMIGGLVIYGSAMCNYVPDSEANINGLIDPLQWRKNPASYFKEIRSAGSGQSCEMIKMYLITFQFY